MSGAGVKEGRKMAETAIASEECKCKCIPPPCLPSYEYIKAKIPKTDEKSIPQTYFDTPEAYDAEIVETLVHLLTHLLTHSLSRGT